MACWWRWLAAVGLCVLLPLGWGCAGTSEIVVAPPVAPPPRPPPVTIILPPPPPPVFSLPADPSFRSPRRPANVVGNLDAPLTRHWKYIVIHHSASDSGNEAIFDRDHRERNHWRGVGYDFVIDNGQGGPDGRVEVTFRWEEQQDGAHAGNEEYNKFGIGICLVGNFDYDRPTAKQMESLVGLINFLQDRCQIPTVNVLGHTHVRVGGTECPGGNFPWYDMFSRLGH